MSETRTVFLKLQSPRFDQFVKGLVSKVLEGWTEVAVAREGFTMYITTLSKEVAVDSDEPEKSIWSCKEGSPAQAVETLPLPYPPVCPSELIPAEADTVVITVPDDTTTEVVTTEFAKSESGFIIRPYTTEELEKLSWPDLTALNKDLGLGKATKPIMIENVVRESSVKWGSVNA